MDFDQIVKRLEWLDEEHRKDKAAIIELEERIAKYEKTAEGVAKQIKPLENQLANLAPTSARIDQFEQMASKQREEINKAIEGLEKNQQKREKELAKQQSREIESLNKELDELKKNLSEVSTLRRELKTRAVEETRMQQEFKDLKAVVEKARNTADELTRAQGLLEDGRKSDGKRVNDVQGELTALRKRLDESRTRSETNADTIRHLEGRIKELLAKESERKAEQSEFIDRQSVAQVDRDRTYKEWLGKYEQLQKQVEKFDTQTNELENTLKAAKRAQDTYTELNAKLERRISEVTEMQRLAEDRLRQEWVTFKADDQKRWTGYTLAQDEGAKDLRKTVQKLEERVNTLTESLQTIQDQLHQTTDAAEQQLQELMNVAHEWLTANERIMGHGKSTKKTKK